MSASASSQPLEHLTRCVLCGSGTEAFAPQGMKAGYSIVRCRQCGLRFVNPRDNLSLISKQYFEDETSPIAYYTQTAPADALNFNKRLELIEKRMPKGRVLDIGCSIGTFLDAARKRGWQAFGVEANPKAAAICSAKGLKVYNRLFDESFAGDSKEEFDLVALNDSIEHFPDPVATLTLAVKVLRPGGYVSVSTPNIADFLARAFQVKPKEHIFYFDKDTMARAFAQAGLKTEMVLETGRRRDVGAMHLGASLSPAWLALSRFLNLTRLDRVASVLLEKMFQDEIFALARKA